MFAYIETHLKAIGSQNVISFVGKTLHFTHMMYLFQSALPFCTNKVLYILCTSGIIIVQDSQ